MSEQQPLDIPQAPAAEKAYLAAILSGNIGESLLYLADNEFTQMRHQLIYEACFNRLAYNQPFDVSLIIEDLAQTDSLDIVTTEYIEELVAAGKTIKPEVAEAHALTIRQKFELCEFKRTAREAAELDNNTSPDELQKHFKKLSESIDDSKSRLRVSRRVELTSAEELRRKFGSQKWLWEGYLPVGHLTLVVAQQGQGKSNFALDICHRLSLGLSMPDGSAPGIDFDPQTDKILYLDAEGFLQGILDRLHSWGSNDSAFLWPKGCDDKRWELNTSSGWAEFESIIAQFRPKVIVIDSLSGANSLEEKDNDQMKILMLQLVSIAKRFGLVLILIHHLRKASVGEPSYPVDLDRIRGASAISQYPRIGLSIGTPDKAQPEFRRLDVIKNNLGSMAPALGFEITHVGVAYGEAPEKPRTDTAVAEAEIFLSRSLAKGSVPTTELQEMAAAEGIIWRTVERAKANKTLNIQVLILTGEGGKRVYHWHIPQDNRVNTT